MTPEREALIRAAWKRVEREAETHLCQTSPCFRAELTSWSDSDGPLQDRTVEVVTFVHEVEHLPGTKWRIVCEGVIVKNGELQDKLSRLIRGNATGRY